MSSAYWCSHAQLCTRATSTPYGKEIPLNWTDNQCVLHWIMGKKPLITFFQNQVKEITETKDISFRYVETNQNPADLATRGVSAQDLDTCELWWRGPKWLQDRQKTWPTWDIPNE